ncbi:MULTISPECIES: IS200/IS605 family element RNA-guided endonuclease TnpB [unclassified Halanaerobium]|uniref:IS200/IS605 family element RNA-guided endonuclease TnpB n=1 Tax=unclassified Halanaerobium TaxID=2641197 RepID=UPI000DF4A1EC|nr:MULTISPECIES: IS200/IS605 family element RNA-guided endonuclease TnpB [unclassified Halanaerobium]RCW41561.1 putative transposase [Halanaerobium sp. MA284_MarDTE_T2]RCW81135.1 putative transposase [Halanaerobium sp. DL-01]
MIKKFKPINKAYKFRIYPNQEQQELIDKTIGCSRFIYNEFLTKTKEENYQSYTKYSRQLPQLKKEYEWLKEVDSIALQQSLKDLDRAFKNFFSGKYNYPKFKSKKSARQSYRTQKFIRSSGSTNIEIKDNYIKLPKLSWVKFVKSKKVKGKINNVTVSKSRAGKYYISINVRQILKTVVNNNQGELGLDLGIKDFLTTSNGEHIENPGHLSKYQDKLAKLQRRLARKEEGSNNWKKLKKKIAKVHEKIKNIRKDFLHKLSTRLTKENQLLVIEDLNVKGMLKNSKLAKHISDCAWNMFTTMLKYKGEWYDCIVHKVDMFFASSQTCNVCGTKNPKVKDLSVRTWTCSCGAAHNRDINAGKNLLKQGKLDLGIR